jgi:hypothetical protein
VLLAVLLAFLGKARTAGVAAWPFGFNWHASSLPFLHEKTPEGIPPRLGKSMFLSFFTKNMIALLPTAFN